MAKLPDGYLYIPETDGDTVAMEKIPLVLRRKRSEKIEVVMCRNCANQECEGRDGQIVCGITGEAHRPDWWCADGERKC